ncbi:MAG: DUF2244 domain-containing protein [Kiloniellales bacterium]|nr:DUF2244 domain-containing protein [Kiloniellales bacterium]
MLGRMNGDPEARAGDEEEVLFDAELTPHRSLPPEGFVLLMGLIGLISFVAGVMFFVVGAWPVVGFLGLDLLLIYLAFRASYRSGRAYETLRLTRHDLTLKRVDSWGRAQRWQLPSTWLQVLIDDTPQRQSQLTLRSHGRSLVVGSFLTPEERVDLAKALRRALAKARCAPAPR